MTSRKVVLVHMGLACPSVSPNCGQPPAAPNTEQAACNDPAVDCPSNGIYWDHRDSAPLLLAKRHVEPLTAALFKDIKGYLY